MPDPEKMRTLEAAEFKIAQTCSTCTHWRGVTWGTCSRLSYQHGKHTELKLAGTPAEGSCASYAASKAAARKLGSYLRFLPQA